ncbi:MAG: hypothetical protein JST55_02065 [Bacteroidetes bacterium]|nr:hypothetical protein [Bacteroidota bacterium]
MKIQIDFHGEMGIVKTLNMDNAIPLPDINDTVEINMEEFVVEDRNFVFSDDSVLVEIFLTKEFEDEEEFDEEEYNNN